LFFTPVTLRKVFIPSVAILSPELVVKRNATSPQIGFLRVPTTPHYHPSPSHPLFVHIILIPSKKNKQRKRKEKENKKSTIKTKYLWRTVGFVHTQQMNLASSVLDLRSRVNSLVFGISDGFY